MKSSSSSSSSSSSDDSDMCTKAEGRLLWSATNRYVIVLLCYKSALSIKWTLILGRLWTWEIQSRIAVIRFGHNHNSSRSSSLQASFKVLHQWGPATGEHAGLAEVPQRAVCCRVASVSDVASLDLRCPEKAQASQSAWRCLQNLSHLIDCDTAAEHGNAAGWANHTEPRVESGWALPAFNKSLSPSLWQACQIDIRLKSKVMDRLKRQTQEFHFKVRKRRHPSSEKLPSRF